MEKNNAIRFPKHFYEKFPFAKTAHRNAVIFLELKIVIPVT